ncbi:MAG: hypothetical protein WEB87_01980 [Bacteriovoracaceae bacterium]
MPFLRKFVILALCAFALAANGGVAVAVAVAVAKEAQSLVLDYKKAMRSHDKKKVRELVTKDYYAKLNENDLLDRLFKSSKKAEKNRKYKIEVVNSKVVQGAVMASAQEEGSEHKDWYKLKKTKDGLKIDQEVHID